MAKIQTTFVLLFISAAAFAQTTVFQHRGIVLDGSGSVNGNYDLILVLHEDQVAPTQVGNHVAIPDVTIVNGVFTTSVSFGTMPFTTRDRLYLEVRYSPVGSGAPHVSAVNREPLLPSAFALRAHHASTAAFAQNADSVQGIYGVNIVQNNPTGAPQPGVTINVGGGVSGWAVNSSSGFNIGWDPVLSAPYDNLFVGRNAGRNSGQSNHGNTFTGTDAGRFNVSGTQNSYYGRSAGENTTSSYNSFFGNYAGASTRLGNSNSFFGQAAGALNDTGSENVFVGKSAGLNSGSGSYNTLVGSIAGASLINADGNTFLGTFSGQSNAGDGYNTLLGFRADSRKGVTNSTAIGNRSRVDASNAVILGGVSGINGAERTSRVGIGTTSPQNTLQVIDPDNTGLRVQTNKTGGTVASFGGNGAFQVDAPGVVGGRVTVQETGNVGLGNNQPKARLHVNGNVRIDSGDILGLGGYGIVLKNRYGQCFRIEVNQSGQLIVSGMFCP